MMPKKRTVEILFPLGGLDRKGSYQRQPPYTTPDCLNVRPVDLLGGRSRGGSRPALERYGTSRVGAEGSRVVRLIR
jgi:hypothetical protein